jgi:UDP-N-acetylmuramoyl-tripeptide--D-alanyl-D-alanine ligase
LGQYEKKGHELVGVRAAQVANELICLGERGRMIATAARQAGMHPAAVSWYPTVDEVTEHLRIRLRKGDIALVKGSHGMRMDAIVAALEGVS